MNYCHFHWKILLKKCQSTFGGDISQPSHMVPPLLLFSAYVEMKWRLSILWLCMFRDQFLAQIDRYSFLWVISQWIIIKNLNHSRLVSLCEYKSSKLRFFSINETSKIIFACLEINRLPLDNLKRFDNMQLVFFFEIRRKLFYGMCIEI